MKKKLWNNIIEELTLEQIIKVLTDLGSLPPKTDGENNLIFQSICHNSDSWKLYYYPETHNFFCFRDWERYNIFTLIMKVKEVEFSSAFNYLTDLLNIETEKINIQQGFNSVYVKNDWEIFDKFNQTLKIKKNKVEEEIVNKNILNLYSNLFYEGWIEENIGIEAMEKYQIKYDILNQRIIIPHFNLENELVGIRCRNLNPEAEAKYCPIYIENKLYNHALSNYLYGLNFNKGNISASKKVMIVESEKSVLQAETYFPENNFVVACCGSNISNAQIELLLKLGITEVILAMDWDFHTMEINDIEYKNFKNKILRLSQKLVPYFTVEILLPPDKNFLYKCSPTDLGKDYLIQSMKKKIVVDYNIICNEKEIEESN